MFCVCKHTGKVLCIFNKDWWEFPQSLRFLQIYLLYIFCWKSFPSLKCWLIWYAWYARQLSGFVRRPQGQMADANIHVTLIILHACKSANICSTTSPHRTANPHNRAELNDSSATSTGFQLQLTQHRTKMWGSWDKQHPTFIYSNIEVYFADVKPSTMSVPMIWHRTSLFSKA